LIRKEKGMEQRGGTTQWHAGELASHSSLATPFPIESRPVRNHS
jgi:hypothetical protein